MFKNKCKNKTNEVNKLKKHIISKIKIKIEEKKILKLKFVNKIKYNAAKMT
jgi:hypothetical protein